LVECNTITRKISIANVKTVLPQNLDRVIVGYFPSFTAGWIISDEGFYGESKLVNFMKLEEVMEL
jgi:hypothetical protein